MFTKLLRSPARIKAFLQSDAAKGVLKRGPVQQQTPTNRRRSAAQTPQLSRQGSTQSTPQQTKREFAPVLLTPKLPPKPNSAQQTPILSRPVSAQQTPQLQRPLPAQPTPQSERRGQETPQQVRRFQERTPLGSRRSSFQLTPQQIRRASTPQTPQEIRRTPLHTPQQTPQSQRHFQPLPPPISTGWSHSPTPEPLAIWESSVTVVNSVYEVAPPILQNIPPAPPPPPMQMQPPAFSSLPPKGIVYLLLLILDSFSQKILRHMSNLLQKLVKDNFQLI